MCRVTRCLYRCRDSQLPSSGNRPSAIGTRGHEGALQILSKKLGSQAYGYQYRSSTSTQSAGIFHPQRSIVKGDTQSRRLPARRSGDLAAGQQSTPHRNRRSTDGKRQLIVHNIGDGPKLEDRLFAFKVTGHYRYVDEDSSTHE